VELDLLRRAVIDGVITTNFDPLLEQLFPDFEVFVGQEALLFENAVGVGEIYKIHGSVEAPDSLVLTRRDYDRFDETNPYLAAKLMTIFVEHPIVFLGYSLSDPNIGAILRAILSCLESSERVAKLADRLMFVDWDSTASECSIARATLPVAQIQLPVLLIRVPSFGELFEVLALQPRTFPARLLRQLKEHVYNLILSTDAKSHLYVQPLDPSEDPRNVDVVFGVGAIETVRHASEGTKMAVDAQQVAAQDDPTDSQPNDDVMHEAAPSELQERAVSESSPRHFELWRLSEGAAARLDATPLVDWRTANYTDEQLEVNITEHLA
jgi:hypothetical protein